MRDTSARHGGFPGANGASSRENREDVSAERFLDDLARTLAEPMPRRRVVRLIGASLIAMSVPGLRPEGIGARSTAICDAGCGPDVRACPRLVQGAPGPPLCCGAPARRYRCEGTWFEPVCVDTCPNGNPCPGAKWSDGCAEFRCCKPPSTCMNGACSETCRHRRSSFDDEETTQYDPRSQCCSNEFGPQPKEGAWLYKACKDTLRARPGYTPSTNGCGTKDFKVADEWPPKATKGYTGKRARWRGICNDHDRCYGTCGRDKDTCDKAFCDALYASCEHAFAKKPSMKARCSNAAALYCLAVKHAARAERAFQDAQREACFCC